MTEVPGPGAPGYVMRVPSVPATEPKRTPKPVSITPTDVLPEDKAPEEPTVEETYTLPKDADD